jgi:hypothetical protein
MMQTDMIANQFSMSKVIDCVVGTSQKALERVVGSHRGIVFSQLEVKGLTPKT